MRKAKELSIFPPMNRKEEGSWLRATKETSKGSTVMQPLW